MPHMDMSGMNMNDLMQRARQAGIKGVDQMNKEQLTQALKGMAGKMSKPKGGSR